MRTQTMLVAERDAVGFVGTGVMGAPMAGHLMDAGWTLHVHNRTRAKVLASIASGAAGSWSLSNLAPKMVAGDFRPGFYVKHFIKDMAMAVEAADAAGLDTPGLDLALSLYRRLAETGRADDGTQGLYRLYADDDA